MLKFSILKHKTFSFFRQKEMAQTQCLSQDNKGHPAKSTIFLHKKSEQAKLVPTLAGVEGLEPSRTVLEVMSYKNDCPNCSHC